MVIHKFKRVKYHMSSIGNLPENIQRILDIYCISLDSQSLSILVKCALDMTDITKSEATWDMPDARIASIVSHGLAMINPTMTLEIVDPSVLETDTSSDTDNDDKEESDGGLLQRTQSCAMTPRQPKTIIAKWDPAQMPK
jgi:hypothetical protein